jgi:hypothetical protein
MDTMSLSPMQLIGKELRENEDVTHAHRAVSKGTDDSERDDQAFRTRKIFRRLTTTVYYSITYNRYKDTFFLGLLRSLNDLGG